MSIFDNDIQEVLFSEEQLKNRVREIAQQITAVRDGKKLEKPHLVNGDYLQE